MLLQRCSKNQTIGQRFSSHRISLLTLHSISSIQVVRMYWNGLRNNYGLVSQKTIAVLFHLRDRNQSFDFDMYCSILYATSGEKNAQNSTDVGYRAMLKSIVMN